MIIRPYESPPVWLWPSCLAIPNNELAATVLPAGPVWQCECLHNFIFLDNKQASRNVY